MQPERAIRILRALSLGILLDLVVTLAVAGLLGLLIVLGLSLQGVPEEALGQRVRDLSAGPLWFGISLVLGSLISLAAGFVTAHQLRVNPYPWLGLMGALLALISFAGAESAFSPFMAGLASLSTLVSVMGGGWLWLWVQR